MKLTTKSKIQASIIAIIAFAIIFYMATDNSANSDNETTHQWYSTSPTNILSTDEAQVDIDNIKTLQKAGWRLLVQDNKPISFNEDGSGRNEIIEKAANNLLHGCYELYIDSDGKVIKAKPSNKAREIFEGKEEVDY